MGFPKLMFSEELGTPRRSLMSQCGWLAAVRAAATLLLVCAPLSPLPRKSRFPITAIRSDLSYGGRMVTCSPKLYQS